MQVLLLLLHCYAAAVMHCSFLFCSLSFVAYPSNNISRFPENFLFLRPPGEQNNPRMPNVHAQIFNFSSSVPEYTPTSVLAMFVPSFLSCHLSSWLCWLRDLLLAISCRFFSLVEERSCYAEVCLEFYFFLFFLSKNPFAFEARE